MGKGECKIGKGDFTRFLPQIMVRKFRNQRHVGIFDPWLYLGCLWF